MNVLSRLLNRSAEQKPLVSLSPGEFWIVRGRTTPKGPRELIYIDAELTLNLTTRKNFVQIRVHDLNNEKEGDDVDELLRDEDKSFLVHPGLQLGYYTVDNRVAIAWKDLEEDGDRFEFLCAPNVTSDALDAFDRIAAESLYLQTHDALPPKDKQEEEYAKLMHDYAKEGASSGSKPAAAAPAAKDAAAPADSSAPAPSDKFVIETRELAEGEPTVSTVCDLCVFDGARNVFMSPNNLRAVEAVILSQGPYSFFLEVRKDGVALLGTPVSESLNQYIDVATNSLVFNCICTDQSIMSYLLLFKSPESLTEFETQLSVALFETKNKKKWTSLADADRTYLIDALNDWTMVDADEASAEDDEDDDEDEDGEDGHASSAALADTDTDANSNERNSALEIGHVNDRTYVVRGRRIGVFSRDHANLKHSTTIESLGFDPKRIMLHEKDRTLVLQNSEDATRLYRMDLETGKVVDEWETHKNISGINPVSKFAQTTDEATLLGVARSSLFRIDPRVAGGIIDTKTEKIYSQNLGFTNIASTADGFFAVGDKRGTIRLYDKMGKAARTQIPGLGDPILGIDVSADGKYVLATCKSYLLLIEAKQDDLNGFAQMWPTKSRPKPRKLTISPENFSYMYQITKEPISFTTARFNTGVDAKEATIVTSTGPYLVTWNLHKVLRNEKNAYRIKQYKSDITAENFEFGTDQRVILTLADDVDIVSKRALKSPDLVLRDGARKR